MRIFVTSDTHGCYDELKSCLDQANFDYENDQLIHCGDTVDRGPKSREVIDLLLSIKNLIAIAGNHDEWWLDLLKTGIHPANWKYGASKTKDSYLIGENLMNVPLEHKNFFNNQILYYIDDDNRFFTHAGFSREHKITSQHESVFKWDRELMQELIVMYGDGYTNNIPDVNKFKRVFIGHTPTLNYMNDDLTAKNKPMYIGQFVQIDTGGCFDEGKISLLDITDDENHILYQNIVQL